MRTQGDCMSTRQDVKDDNGFGGGFPDNPKG